MSDDTFDDGLVHSHHWATEKPMTNTQADSAEREMQHDDGLVHGHEWASGSK